MGWQALAKISRRDRLLIAFSVFVSVFVLVFALLFPFEATEYVGLGYLGIALVNFLNSATLFSPVPAFLATMIAAQSFNPLMLIPFSALTVSIGECSAYLFGDGIDSIVSPKKWHLKLKRLYLKSPFWFLVLWIALPNPIQAFGQIFAGSTGYPLHKLFAATLLGNLIWYTAVVLFGQYLANVGVVF